MTTGFDPMKMTIDVKREGSVAVVYVVGEVDLSCSPKLREIILDLLRKRAQKEVIVDLSAVPQMDSSGIASLIEAYQEAKKQGARLVLVGLHGGPRHAMELAGLLEVFEIYATEQDARAKP
jgi:anti-sigma B factor antagonist